jgi:hypothetical protein
MIYLFLFVFLFVFSKSEKCIYYKNMLRNMRLRFYINNNKKLNNNKINNIKPINNLYTQLQVKSAEIQYLYNSLSEEERMMIDTVRELLL